MHAAAPNTRRLKGRGEPVLYLDYDGVLHHENVLWHPKRGAYLRAPEGYRLFQHAELLEALIEPHPQIHVVLSTSWVRQYGCADAAKRLPAGLRQRVVGATFHSAMPSERFALLPRGVQVTDDVLRRRPGAWLALDDDDTGWPPWAVPHFVHTDSNEGIGLPKLQDVLRERIAMLADLRPTAQFPDAQVV